jgi:hypothetical protein
LVVRRSTRFYRERGSAGRGTKGRKREKLTSHEPSNKPFSLRYACQFVDGGWRESLMNGFSLIASRCEISSFERGGNEKPSFPQSHLCVGQICSVGRDPRALQRE